MRYTFFSKRGETILESVIAMTVLAVGLGIASTIMATSIRNMSASKNRIIAVSLAREGLEAVRNVRDTNWLKFGSKKRECWNHDPATDVCNDANQAIQPASYMIFKEKTNRGWKWRLFDLDDFVKLPQAPDNHSPPYYYNTEDNQVYAWEADTWVFANRLDLVDVDPETDTDLDHDYTNDTDAYNHLFIPDTNIIPLGQGTSRKSVFRRTLVISYLDHGGNTTADTSANRMRIQSKVTWQEGKYEFKTDLKAELTDYLGRENLNN